MKTGMKAWTAAVVLAVCAGGLAGGRAWGQAAPAGPAPTKLAVVNIVMIFDSLTEKADADAAMEKMKTELDTEGHRRQDEVTALKNEVDNPRNFKRGTPEYKNEQDTLLQKAFELQAFSGVMQAKLQGELRLRTTDMYRKINDAVAEYAQANGIALVFVADKLTLENATTQEQLQQMILTRKIFYAHPSFDITSNIIQRMNAAYSLGAGKK